MVKVLKLFVLATSLVQLASSEGHETGILQRKKRYLAFPKGSSLQLVYCFILTAYGTEGIFVFGITIGLAWEIPTNLRQYLFQNTPAQLHARDRRSLYKKAEIFINRYGENGRTCVLRAICEASKTNYEKPSFMRKILHTIFKFPVVEAEDENHYFYNEAATEKGDCSAMYPCSLSILFEDVT